MNKFNIEILSPEGSAYNGAVESAMFPTAAGIITVLAGHANLVTKLIKGEIIIKNAGVERKITISGGFLEISENKVNAVAEFAMNSEDANKQKISRAFTLAQEMKTKKADAAKMLEIETQLKRSVSGLKSGVNAESLKRKNK